MQAASARLCQCANLPLSGGSLFPSIKARISAGIIRLTLSGHVNTESDGNTPRGVASGRIVGIAVVVDISGIGREAAPHGRKHYPPQAFTNNNPCCVYSFFCGKTLFCLRQAFNSAISLYSFSQKLSKSVTLSCKVSIIQAKC